MSLTSDPIALETRQTAGVKPLLHVQGHPSHFGSISGDIPTHSALPERSKVDESVLESSFL